MSDRSGDVVNVQVRLDATLHARLRERQAALARDPKVRALVPEVTLTATARAMMVRGIEETEAENALAASDEVARKRAAIQRLSRAIDNAHAAIDDAVSGSLEDDDVSIGLGEPRPIPAPGEFAPDARSVALGRTLAILEGGPDRLGLQARVRAAAQHLPTGVLGILGHVLQNARAIARDNDGPFTLAQLAEGFDGLDTEHGVLDQAVDFLVTAGALEWDADTLNVT